MTLNGRQPERLATALANLRNVVPKANANIAVGDITTESGRAALLSACPEADILINNNAGPAPGVLADWDREAWVSAFDANMIPAMLLIRALLPGMRFAQIRPHR